MLIVGWYYIQSGIEPILQDRNFNGLPTCPAPPAPPDTPPRPRPRPRHRHGRPAHSLVLLVLLVLLPLLLMMTMMRVGALVLVLEINVGVYLRCRLCPTCWSRCRVCTCCCLLLCSPELQLLGAGQAKHLLLLLQCLEEGRKKQEGNE